MSDPFDLKAETLRLLVARVAAMDADATRFVAEGGSLATARLLDAIQTMRGVDNLTASILCFAELGLLHATRLHLGAGVRQDVPAPSVN